MSYLLPTLFLSFSKLFRTFTLTSTGLSMNIRREAISSGYVVLMPVCCNCKFAIFNDSTILENPMQSLCCHNRVNTVQKPVRTGFLHILTGTILIQIVSSKVFNPYINDADDVRRLVRLNLLPNPLDDQSD